MWSCGHERWISASGGDSREGREQEAPPSSAGGDGVKRGEASGTAEQGRGAGADGAPPGGGGGDAEDKAAQEANAQQAIQAMALLRRTRRALGGSLLAQVFRPVAKLAVDYMMRTTLTSLDPEHDSEEFLEAVGDAYCMVNHLLSGQDLEALRPMMTAQLHQSFTETVEKIDSSGFDLKINVEDIKSVEMQDMVIDTKDNMLRTPRHQQLATLLPNATPEEAAKATLEAWQASRAQGGASQRPAPDGETAQPEPPEAAVPVDEEVTDQIWVVFSLAITSHEQWIFTSKADSTFVRKKTFPNCVSVWRFVRGPFEVTRPPGSVRLSAKSLSQMKAQVDDKPWVLLTTFW
eukprot:jgi/Tetstr1/423080/TSEL_013851.t1